MTRFYHGSSIKLKAGTILSGRGEDYEKKWGNNIEYKILEDNRPDNFLSHKESVFMTDNIEDIDNAGGATDFLFTVKPLGPVEKHDMAWQSEILLAIQSGANLKEIKGMANKYWEGVATENPVWEYLTRKAKIIKVEEY